MSETSLYQKELNNSRDALLTAIVQCKERAEIGRTNAKKLASFESELKFYKTRQADIKETINYIRDEYKNIEQYLINKKEISMEMLKLAIEKAGLVVPDADITGIHLAVGDKSAKVINDKGQDINLREGSAFRTVMGLLMRYTLLKTQPDALQVLLLDEAFSTLSDTTAATMREYLDAIKEDVLIIGIEQRAYLYEGIERITYIVTKEEDKTSSVRRLN